MPAKPKKLTYNPLDLLVADDPAAPAGPVTELDPAAIQPNPQQPRQYYDPADQAELAESIQAAGIHQPLIVRPVEDGAYQLVAGSRRLAAARAVGLATVPVIVREYTDEEAEQVALVENLQRSTLRFDDEAHALLRLKRHFGLTNETIGRSIGKSTDYVELRIAAAENPVVLDLYLRGRIEQKQIRAAIRALKDDPRGGEALLAGAFPAVDGAPTEGGAGDANAADPNGSDAGRRSVRGGRRPPDGWRWAGDAERRLQQLPTRAARMDSAERVRAREYLLRLREAADHALTLLDD
jgi:ParB/RepB/Spo0J family partition protein